VVKGGLFCSICISERLLSIARTYRCGLFNLTFQFFAWFEIRDVVGVGVRLGLVTLVVRVDSQASHTPKSHTNLATAQRRQFGFENHRPTNNQQQRRHPPYNPSRQNGEFMPFGFSRFSGFTLARRDGGEQETAGMEESRDLKQEADGATFATNRRPDPLLRSSVPTERPAVLPPLSPPSSRPPSVPILSGPSTPVWPRTRDSPTPSLPRPVTRPLLSPGELVRISAARNDANGGIDGLLNRTCRRSYPPCLWRRNAPCRSGCLR
jgi:hypothetical protein